MNLAIYAVNNATNAHMTDKGLRVLIGLETLAMRGKPVNRRQLMKWLFRVHAVSTEQGAYFMLRRLVEAGYMEQDGQGYGAEIRLSLMGRNYIKWVERYLKQMRLNEL